MILRGLPFLLLLCPLAGAMENPEDRIAVVSRLYGDFGGEKHPNLIDQPLSVLQRSFTPGLTRLLAMEAKRRKEAPAELGHLDFEPLSGSQDPDIHDLSFRPSGHNNVMVLYRTSNGEKISVLHHLHPVEGGWRIDDISYAEPRCSLRALLNQRETRSPTSFTEPSLEAAPISPLPSRATDPSRGELAKADTILNSQYQTLAAALGIDARERLIRAQRMWIRQRDVFAASNPLRRAEALLHATRQRSAELAAILAGPVLPGR